MEGPRPMLVIVKTTLSSSLKKNILPCKCKNKTTTLIIKFKNRSIFFRNLKRVPTFETGKVPIPRKQIFYV